MSESHHQNDEIGNPFKLSGTIYKEQFQKFATNLGQFVNMLP